MTLTIEIKQAIPMDLMEIDYVSGKGDKRKKHYKLCVGIPYFLKNSKGVIENNPYRTTRATDLKSLKEYFKNEQVFIIKN